ncbi:MAG TPA: rhodanese-like domain-containing protein [Phnomibacter sp.]|nr:rhodanese-like domain-containing protein [Phnomibacter sp.]
MQELSSEDLIHFLEDDDKIILDLRDAENFAASFLPGSISFSYTSASHDNALALALGADRSIILVCAPDADVDEMVMFAEKCGFKTFAGIYNKPLRSLNRPTGQLDMVITIDADELAMDLPHDENLMLVDVRTSTEFDEGHLSEAYHLPITNMGDPASIALLPEYANLYIYCSDGRRSLTAASLLKKQGIHNLRVVTATWDQLSTLENMNISKDPGKLN